MDYSDQHARQEDEALDQRRTAAPTFPLGSPAQERLAADQRARRLRQSPDSARETFPIPGSGDDRLINKAVAALCESVRDYAIFVLNPEGVIVYWGMGAHLMKWWTREEAQGSHLRMLYPEGGGEDGTAEAHLAQSAATGEYVGEGQRVRRGGSTFWAHVTLTALIDSDGSLLGFAKVTQDLTRRRATEAAVALASEAESTRQTALTKAQEADAARAHAEAARQQAEQARERAEEAAAFAREQARAAQTHISDVLQPALLSEQAERASLRVEVDAYAQMHARRNRGFKDGEPEK